MPALLPQWSLLRFSGADAQAFLHGQLTCDVAALQAGSSSYGGYCTAKGRLLATFLLWLSADGYTMLLPAALAEAIRKRLTMYVLRSKVTIEDLTPERACVGVFGVDAAQQLADLGAAIPQRRHGVAVRDGVTVIELPVQRYLAVLPRPQAGMAEGGEAWAALDIAAGIPFILPATQEEFVPQMVNLDLIGGLSYTKGCYPGQEIVARTHYLGRLKQRMCRARVSAPAAPGDKLYCAELGEQSGGMIVNSALAHDGRCDVLAVIQTAQAAAAWHLGSLHGPTLEPAPLPYTTN
ncbi:MAG: folate-binding protein YgfZ [Burkholderiales bacterium]|nr:folate-binding protein YgfZ [Burkholderiales bacterium]